MGSGRSSTALTMVNVPTVAPMPAASVTTAVSANAGALISVRMAQRKS